MINLAAGVPERNWTDKHLRNGFDELLNLCVQFRRIESFSKFSYETGSKPLAFITSDSKGNYKEYTAYVKSDAGNEQDITDMTNQLSEKLGTISKDDRLTVLTSMLTELMEENEVTKENA